MMGIFNNLVLLDQNAKQNSLQSIVPRSGHWLVLERGQAASGGTTAGLSRLRMSNAPGNY
jgi:hypothetical protein